MKAPQTEGELETQILNFLVSKGLFCWRNNTQGTFDEKQGIWRNGNAYSIRGVPDILGIFPDGRLLAIEVKHPIRRPKPSAPQEAFLKRASSLGAIAFAAYDLGYVVLKLAPYIDLHGDALENPPST